jgi:hydrogenase maturation protein HypF
VAVPSERLRERTARRIRITGIVQGVGFRPFVYRLALSYRLGGWVLNHGSGVEIHAEGSPEALAAFLDALQHRAPPAARVTGLESFPVPAEGFDDFAILESQHTARPAVRVSPDLPVCQACLRELFDPRDRRFHYPYITCTDCGPRYSIVLGLPYDRPRTTMRDWPLCPACARDYHDPADRRFHAQPVACPRCGPSYLLRVGDEVLARGEAAIAEAAGWLRSGRIVAVKGIGGYHLACDARDVAAVAALRERKFRKEKPFALMVRDLEVAQELAELDEAGLALLGSTARPIVLAPAKRELPGVAPDNRDLGLMLPYTPLHHLLFALGAPSVLVMTSANRSEEPIAYQDEDAFERLFGIADAFLVGERPIARRIDDSVARGSPLGPMVLRRSRGYAPGAAATFPARRPILALGADLKNSVTLVVDGQAFVSQHLGDLEHHAAFQAFRETVHDLCRMYEVRFEDALVVHDMHPEYVSTRYALELPGKRLGVQHHRAHIASVLAERGLWETPVIGCAFDGTGYGDDGTIWGGEVLVGSLEAGFERVAHLRPAVLPGGDAAARWPVQAAAGFLAQLPEIPQLVDPPFAFPERYLQARELVVKGVRSFVTTSVGRLFDTVAALLGFTRGITFEGQAAIWLEHLARTARSAGSYPFPLDGHELDFRPLLAAVLADRVRGRNPAEIARAFHEAVAQVIERVALRYAEASGARHVALSGGVFQNALLLARVADRLGATSGLTLLINREVPPNDGGISLGQAAVAALTRC